MRSQTADVSVVIPAYNCARYVGHAIDSALRQTIGVRQILVIDDGSTDDTDEAIRRFRKRRIVRYIRIENAGQAHARNLGASLARGAWVAFLDADDMWEPHKIEAQTEMLAHTGRHVCYADMRAIDMDGNRIPYPRGSSLALRSGCILDDLFVNNFIPHSSLIVSKRMIDEVGGFDESLRMGDDWDLVLRLAARCEFDLAPEKLIRYRVRTNQLSSRYEQRIADQDRIVRKFLGRHGGMLSLSQIRKGAAFRARSRGYHYAPVAINRSLRWYLRSAAIEPLNSLTYRGMLRAILCMLQRRCAYARTARLPLPPYRHAASLTGETPMNTSS